MKNYGNQTTSTAVMLSSTTGSVISTSVPSSLFTQTSNPGFIATFTFPTGNYCFSFWKYITSFGTAGGANANYGNMLRINSPSETNIWISPNASGNPWNFNSQANIGAGNKGSVFPAGVWNHCVFNYNGVTFSIYRNGALDFSSTANIFSPYAGQSNTAMYVDGFGSQFLPGYLSDFRLYNRGLSAVEVTALYNNTVL
jgi:hypothetical protein